MPNNEHGEHFPHWMHGQNRAGANVWACMWGTKLLHLDDPTSEPKTLREALIETSGGYFTHLKARARDAQTAAVKAGIKNAKLVHLSVLARSM